MNTKRSYKKSVVREGPGEAPLHPWAMLCIVNKIFRTNCEDVDAIDAAAAWQLIVEELKSYKQLSLTLALRHQAGMKLREVGRILGISGPRVNQRCEQALRILRHPERITRIRNSIVGWPNLYRDLSQFGYVSCSPCLDKTAITGSGAVKTFKKMAGVAGLEPVTSAVTGQRSNQLSYTPAKGILRLKNFPAGVKISSSAKCPPWPHKKSYRKYD
jgi:hypothetical protein